MSGSRSGVRLWPVGALFILGATGMRVASPGLANLSYLLLAAYALLGRGPAIHALALSWLFTMLSSGVAPIATAAGMGRYAVIAAGAVSIFVRAAASFDTAKFSRVGIATALLGAFFIIHAVLFSSMVEVSVLKALAWLVAMATLLSAWTGLGRNRESVAGQLFGGLVILMLVSAVLLPSPLGYLRNQAGFQGVLSHPQAFGLTMSLLGAWAAGMIAETRHPSWRLIVVLVSSIVLVILSEARTAGFALLLGVVLSAILVPMVSRRPRHSLFPRFWNPRVVIVLFVAVAGFALAGPRALHTVYGYLSKRSDVQSVFQVYRESRGPLTTVMLDNIRDHPMTGIGFGIASEPSSMVVSRDPVLGLPVGASIEKGVLPLAILEETGLPGLFLVGAWVWLLLARAARIGGIAAFTVLSTALLLNMGEYVLFSPGGMGLLPLILVAWAATTDRGIATDVA